MHSESHATHCLALQSHTAASLSRGFQHLLGPAPVLRHHVVCAAARKSGQLCGRCSAPQQPQGRLPGWPDQDCACQSSRSKSAVAGARSPAAAENIPACGGVPASLMGCAMPATCKGCVVLNQHPGRVHHNVSSRQEVRHDAPGLTAMPLLPLLCCRLLQQRHCSPRSLRLSQGCKPSCCMGSSQACSAVASSLPGAQAPAA